ncbi:hypothetical protein COLO4_33633 [Corchorus olitorius]|uniref:Uncharacterized protein n=1 Tax=Corchorus olitorius TaxID=93759 RepID=A0A1R3GSA2_9ROSI|nr:hypothetical protein COLO4_33633 [Corchorus olitorius]
MGIHQSLIGAPTWLRRCSDRSDSGFGDEQLIESKMK